LLAERIFGHDAASRLLLPRRRERAELRQPVAGLLRYEGEDSGFLVPRRNSESAMLPGCAGSSADNRNALCRAIGARRPADASARSTEGHRAHAGSTQASRSGADASIGSAIAAGGRNAGERHFGNVAQRAAGKIGRGLRATKSALGPLIAIDSVARRSWICEDRLSGELLSQGLIFAIVTIFSIIPILQTITSVGNLLLATTGEGENRETDRTIRFAIGRDGGKHRLWIVPGRLLPEQFTLWL
jgi:hypothetical protein